MKVQMKEYIEKKWSFCLEIIYINRRDNLK